VRPVSTGYGYGYLPRSFCTLDELREDTDEQLLFLCRYNPNCVLHRLIKTLITIYANALTILFYRWAWMLLWSKTLFFKDIYWFFYRTFTVIL